jgi:UDP-N-acetyl-D-glucosamine/UDP-N-acetyl-D-galactosamine dehydrogenase
MALADTIQQIESGTGPSRSKFTSERIAVLGLGYVGLPVAIAFSKVFERVVGFDISRERIEKLRNGHDWTGEVPTRELRHARLNLTADAAGLAGTTFFIVTVPTPVDLHRRPDLAPLQSACETIGPNLTPGSVVVFESTVYPGVTEEFCGPILERVSGLKRSEDFTVGYSPERINPGDKEHRLESIIKVVSGEDKETLDRVAAVYGSIISAGVYRAANIKVAEAAKVLENTQRDLNIALMNELAIIMDRMGLRTNDVLDAARTKWNFLRFEPGLVGGHCIGVDPFYLTSAAEAHGYHPYVILAGRRVNDEMGRFVARKLVKLLIETGRVVKETRVAILGLTFKPNISDIRNSKVIDIVKELQEFGIAAYVQDPHADSAKAKHEYGIDLVAFEALDNMDAIVLAVNHSQYACLGKDIQEKITPGGVLIDVKSLLDRSEIRPDIHYWSL